MSTTLPRTAAALRMLLAAWCADGEHIPTAQRDWLLRQLVDPCWIPSPTLRERMAPRFLTWAEHHGITATVRLALEESA